MTREHGGVDVLIGQKDLPTLVESLEGVGYSALRVYFEVVPGQPLVLGAERDGMPLEVGVYDEVEAGAASFVLPTTHALTRFHLPGDTLLYPVTEVAGAFVRTVSPLALFHLREAFSLSGVFGPPRDRDIAVQSMLRDRLLSNMTKEDFRLRTVPA